MDKFIDGTPITKKYLAKLHILVSEAADGDPGEQGEDDARNEFAEATRRADEKKEKYRMRSADERNPT